MVSEKEKSAEEFFVSGVQYYEQKDFIFAIEQFTQAIQLNKNCIKYYIKRGRCYYQLPNKNIEIYTTIINDFNKAFDIININICKDDFSKRHQIYDNMEEELRIDCCVAEGLLAYCYFERGKLYCNKKELKLSVADFDNAVILLYAPDDENIIDEMINLAIEMKEYKKAIYYFKQGSYFTNISNTFLKFIDISKELEEKNKQLELEIQDKEKAYKIAHKKEQEMISFFTHTMRNALATAPESLRQAIRLLGSEDYEKNQKHYEAINEITALFSTISLTDCLIDTFKQSINEPEEFKRAWQQDNTGNANPHWFIAAALRQSLNRIIFMEDATQLRALLNNQSTLIRPTRKAFIENVLPLDVNQSQQDVAEFYNWLESITTIEISLETSTVHFGAQQIKFSLLFAISSELILNALKYWSGAEKIQVHWFTEQENYVFNVKNACKANASSQLVGTHKGLAFIKRLVELLGEQAQFNCVVENELFCTELKLSKTLLEG